VPPGSWQVAGRPSIPIATRAAVTGERIFVTDLDDHELWHGALLRPPVLGATLRDLDASALADRRDVVLVRRAESVGVVASEPGLARAALALLSPEWVRPDAPSEVELEGYLRAHPASESRAGAARFITASATPRARSPRRRWSSAPPTRPRTSRRCLWRRAPHRELRPRRAASPSGRAPRRPSRCAPRSPRRSVFRSATCASSCPDGGGFGGKHAGGSRSRPRCWRGRAAVRSACVEPRGGVHLRHAAARGGDRHRGRRRSRRQASARGR